MVNKVQKQKPSRRSSQKTEGKGLRLEFPDNKKLIELCGHHEENLILLEEGLEVQIVVRGNQVAIFGPDENMLRAKDILEELYRMLEAGLSVPASQIEVILRAGDDVTTETTGGPAVNKQVIHTPLKKVAPRTKRQRKYVEALRQSALVFGVGPAGTGKTYLATALAVEMLHAKQVKRIILTRPVVEAGENLGFLPGTFEEKIDPYLRPFFDAMHELVGPERTAEMMEKKIIEVAPLAYMRGRTISNAFMLLDEAQNTTVTQMKMFLTRMGEGSRMVVTGDPSQIDLKPTIPSGLKDSLDVLSSVEGVDVCRFNEVDVVRHDLVSKIVGAYDARDKKREASKV